MPVTDFATKVTGATDGASEDSRRPRPSAFAPGKAVTVISARRGWFDWRLAQVWRYRDLIGLFVRRDFVSLYTQSVLGPAWHVIQPLLTTLTYTVIFGRVARLPTDGAPPFLFYMVGTLAWNYFANCLNNTSRTFVANAYLLGKVYFHRLVIPISLVISNLVAFGIQAGIFVVILASYLYSDKTVHLTRWAFTTPLLIAMLAGFGLGGGIIVSALTTRYRDFTYLVALSVQLIMYATPVIYPASSVPASYQWIPRLNPLTPIMEAFRLGFLGVGAVTPLQLASSFVVMIVLLVIGLMLFTQVERTFNDTV